MEMFTQQEDYCDTRFIYFKSYEIIKNPTATDFRSKIRECRAVKGFKYYDDIYIWDAHELIHYNVQQFLQLKNIEAHQKLFNYYKIPFHSYHDFIVQGNILTFDSLGDYDIINPIFPILLLAEKKKMVAEVEQMAQQISQRFNLVIDEMNIKTFNLYKNIVLS